MSIEKMREDFEAWIRAEVERDDRVVRIVRERNRYSGRDKHFLNTSWAAWQASRAALPTWQPMETCPKHVDVLFYREDCGVINGQFTYADSFMTDKERESGDYSEEEQFAEDAWCYGPQGVERMDGDLVPTHWMPYPAEPEVKP